MTLLIFVSIIVLGAAIIVYVSDLSDDGDE